MRSAGVWVAVAAVVLFSLMGMLVKVAQTSLPTLHVVFARSLISMLLLLPLILRQRPYLGHRRRLLTLRGGFGLLGLAGTFYAIGELLLVDAILIFQAVPLFVLPLSSIFIKEHNDGGDWVLMLVGFGGVALVIRPSGSSLTAAPSLIALGGAFCAACAYVTVRALQRSGGAHPPERPEVVVFYFALMSALGTLPYVIYRPAVPTSWTLVGVLLGIGLVATVAQGLITIGYRLQKARKMAIVNYLGVPLAALWGYTFWDEVPSGWTAAGTVLILGAMTAMELRR